MSQFSSDKPQVFIPPAFEDFRGYLSVPYDRDVPFQVCQINQGYSREAFTLRGLHFQMGEHAQAKMVSCLHGSIFNVAVDLRPGKCFGYSYSEVLSFENRKMMYIPKGFAHGYLTLEDDTLMHMKPLLGKDCPDYSLPIFNKRPEQLSVEQFVELTLITERNLKDL